MYVRMYVMHIILPMMFGSAYVSVYVCMYVCMYVMHIILPMMFVSAYVSVYVCMYVRMYVRNAHNPTDDVR
jgi:hypothetical protein